MGIFGDSTPKVSNSEFHRVRQSLSQRGFSHQQLERVQVMFDSSLAGHNDKLRGIDQKELESTISAMKDHEHANLFKDHEIAAIEEEMRKHL